MHLKHVNHKYKRVIAMAEKSQGNEKVGDMWIEAKSFDKQTPIDDIVTWAALRAGVTGKLIITIDEDGCESEEPF